MSVDETVRSYDRDAAAYGASTAAMTDAVRARVQALAAHAGPGARVLEIGSGGGLDVVTGAGWTDVSVRSGVAGHRGASWLEVSAVRDSVSP